MNIIANNDPPALEVSDENMVPQNSGLSYVTIEG